MYYKAQEKFVRVKYNPKLDPGSLENTKNILDANPMQGVMEQIYELKEACISAEETFIKNSIVEVGVDPDALIRTAKLNAHLQTVLKNTLKELEEAKRKAVEACKQSDGVWLSEDKKGHSIYGFMVCSVCDVMIPDCSDKCRYCLPRLDFCPRCGAKMKGGAE